MSLSFCTLYSGKLGRVKTKYKMEDLNVFNEANRLVKKFGSYAESVALEIKAVDESQNKLFWDCVIVSISKIRQLEKPFKL